MMNESARADTEDRLHKYWEKVLNMAPEDARAEKFDNESMAIFPETMAHVAIARMADQIGAGRAGWLLFDLSQKLIKTAIREKEAAPNNRLPH